VLTTSVDYVFNWARKSALWPLTFGLACCAIEVITASTSRSDIARFSAEVFRPSPAVGPDDRSQHRHAENGPAIETHLGPDARPQVMHRHGRVRQRRGPSTLTRCCKV